MHEYPPIPPSRLHGPHPSLPFRVGGRDGSPPVTPHPAGGLPGSFSMGTGEYVSVTNQNELVLAEVATERTMHARFPDAEQAELAETFLGYGADPETAARMAAAVSRDPDTALRVHTREELGVDPFELPSPVSPGSRRWSRSPPGRSSRCCRTWRACPSFPPPWAWRRWRC